jgi:hypothetical protein
LAKKAASMGRMDGGRPGADDEPDDDSVGRPRLDRIAKALKVTATTRGALAAFPRDALVPGRDLILVFRQRDYIPSEPAAGTHYTGMRIPIRQSDVSSWR